MGSHTGNRLCMRELAAFWEWPQGCTFRSRVETSQQGSHCRIRHGENMDSKIQTKTRQSTAGFSMIELCIVVTITMVMMGMAIPMMRQTTFNYRLNGAVASVTGAIRATRYQALMKGYPYRLAITPSSKQYQLQNDPERDGSYANVGTAVPITSNAVTISATTTLEFRPNGRVSATTGAMNLDVSFQGVTKTITVSNYGNVTVTP